ncbi:TPA: hypothetical protein ACV5GZ_006032 [Bacillus thuringiensis]
MSTVMQSKQQQTAAVDDDEAVKQQVNVICEGITVVVECKSL